MKLTFTTDFDGTLDIQPGDSLELQITGKSDDGYQANIIRQTGVRSSPPDLGVSVGEQMGLEERLV